MYSHRASRRAGHPAARGRHHQHQARPRRRFPRSQEGPRPGNGRGHSGLVVSSTKSGLVVSGVMLARAIPAILIGPLAGVVLDRFDRKRVMIASDLARAIIAAAFVFTIHRNSTWLLYVLSGLLMVASP